MSRSLKLIDCYLKISADADGRPRSRAVLNTNIKLFSKLHTFHGNFGLKGTIFTKNLP